MARTNLAVKHIDDDDIPRIVGKRIKIESLKKIEPKTENQKYAMQEWACNQHLVMKGSAGTGKSFLAIYMAMKDILLKRGEQEKLIVIRSAVATRELGFLPGSLEEKVAVYEEPYVAIFEELFPLLKNGSSAADKLREQKLYEFASSSYLRGITFHNATIVVDEISSMTFHELDTIMTRVGEGCRIIFCGDEKQSDLIHNKNDKSGMYEFLNVINKLEEFSFVDFKPEDILRSKLVKRYILARDK